MKKLHITKSIFKDYKTVILDLDATIWNGMDINGNNFWAKQLQAPFTRIENNILVDIAGNMLMLHEFVRETLECLYTNDINIGFISVGSLLNCPYDKQPSVNVLRSLDIYHYFTWCRILRYKHINKADVIRPEGKTLYIDDHDQQLAWIRDRKFDNLDLMNRNMFVSW